MPRGWIPVLVALGSVARADGSEPAVRAHAVRRTGAIAIDGRLDEADWAAAPRQGGFVQRFPRDASKPSLDTRFAVLYDDEAIYVGVWADDPRPDLIRALLTRRDVDAPADAVMVAIDSYHDRRTAYAFQLNAAGVQRDVLLFDDVSSDDTWDAVWTGDAARTATGWTAEYRIPLSQLRFPRGDTQEWGLQVVRTIGRTGEQDAWSPWPRSTPQVVSKFGVIDGVDHLRPALRLELMPYATAGVDRKPVAAGDPIDQRYNLRRSVGLDVRYGLGPAFTLSATINPDFSQVEADPSKINLTANELFFAEKRPFFLEGVDLFKLPIGSTDSSVETAFYSRRIGAAPAPPDIPYDFLDAPAATTIYGAAKLTGKTASGWSVGVLDAVTGQEAAETFTAATPGTPGVRAEPVVAPLTNYAVARIKRDLGEGRTSIGASATAVDRDLAGTGLEAVLHDQAYTAGAQLQHRWADNAWTADVNVIGSWVHGSQDAIALTQQSAVHYFQRPGATELHFDPARTSLSGLAAKWQLGQFGDTPHWRFGITGELQTPGLELNDAGYQVNTDRVVPDAVVQYHDDAPGAHLLNWGLNVDAFTIHTFEARLVKLGLEGSANAQLANYWRLSVFGYTDRTRWSINALRGGPALRYDPESGGSASVTTDTRAPVWFSLAVSGSRNLTSGRYDSEVDLGATIQALPNLDLFAGPSLYVRDDPLQYVAEVADPGGPSHFVLARIHETDASLTLRLNWTFSPSLALQAYAQPFLASGRYDQFKDVDHPDASRYADRFRVLAPGSYAFTGGADPGSAALSFDRPDFNFRQLRSTVVLRWEYRPGSAVLAIWTHGRTSDAFDDGRVRIGRDLAELARTPGEDVVLVKLSYWIGL
ncbi:MAG TPA: DUF5916 domain-containing protein [Kofleriaceae bacterium]|jgi:hypothetical protein|nr:DUF5916 domain-containing protein [Kofleriaceae bacterium]